MSDDRSQLHPLTDRRGFLVRGVALGAGMVGLPAVLAACGGESGSSTAAGGTSATVQGAAGGEARPVRGGSLRVAIPGMSTGDTLDPANASTTASAAMTKQIFETLAGYDTAGKLENLLAEEITYERPDQWVVRVKEATWHDGRPVSADDVIFTFRRILTPKGGLYNAAEIAFIDPDRIRKLDERTVRFHFHRGAMYFPDTLCKFNQAIVPVGFDPRRPIGSGPFTLASYAAGQRATFRRFGEFRIPEQPYLDELVFISFEDGTSQANGLIGGQVDVAPDLDASLIPVVRNAGSDFNVFTYPSSATLTWPMNTARKPFDDVRVRQAFRYAVNRQQLIDQVYAGEARLANDFFGPYDPGYAADIPQREQDLEQARSLLRQAGYDRVAIELTAAPILPPANRQNEVMVEQVKAAGFDVRFRKVDIATFYGPQYGTYPLSLSLWGIMNILDQSALTIVRGSPYNATKWQDPEYDRLFQQASNEPDEAKRNDILHRMQEISHERGSYAVTQFHDFVTGYAARVTGYRPYPNSEAGSDFRYREMGFRS